MVTKICTNHVQINQSNQHTEVTASNKTHKLAYREKRELGFALMEVGRDPAKHCTFKKMKKITKILKYKHKCSKGEVLKTSKTFVKCF